MIQRTYALVTPAQNEQVTIETTIVSVVSQTILPKEWIIVSDRSRDRTDEIVKRCAAGHDFIRLLRLNGQPGHSFAAVVQATEAGLRALQSKDHAYIGLLDADVSFPPDYYEKLIAQFELDPKLGLAGGLVLDVGDTKRIGHQNLNEIAGATQFFSRACFESLGGLLPIPEGGWDTITCARARMNGFRTTTLPWLVMNHLKPRNAALGNWWQRNWQFGVRDYVLAGHPAFEIAKCSVRILEPPALVSAIARLSGYSYSLLTRRKYRIPHDLAMFLRREQLQRMSLFIRGRGQPDSTRTRP